MAADPTLTFLYPYFERGKLLRNTLRSFQRQKDVEPEQYEILIIDDGSTREPAREVVPEFRKAGLQIRVAEIQIPPKLQIFVLPDGSNNPAVAINVGIDLARGEKIVLSSPEIMHMRGTNISRLLLHPLLRCHVLFCDVWDDDMKFFISGGENKRALCFLSLHWTTDLRTLGGIDERFMYGHGYDDADFTRRMKSSNFVFEFSGRSIYALHQSHYRPMMVGNVNLPVRKAYHRNMMLHAQLTRENTVAAYHIPSLEGLSTIAKMV